MGRALLDPYYDEVLMYTLKNVYDWWDEFNNSRTSQNWISQILATLYGIVTLVALVNFPTIEAAINQDTRVPQKVFDFLNVLVNGDLCLILVFHNDVQNLKPEIVQHVLFDVPSLVFFTTYALLVLFWAEIYYEARTVSTNGLQPTFFAINGIIYAIQIVLWLVIWWKPISALVILSKMFFAGVSLFAALGFLLYVGRLFLMLQRFPVESKGRQKKLLEIGYVTTVCFACFLVRCIMMCFSAFDEAANLDLMEHAFLNFIYYLLVEILPSSLVLTILRKLPTKQVVTPYHLIQ